MLMHLLRWQNLWILRDPSSSRQRTDGNFFQWTLNPSYIRSIKTEHARSIFKFKFSMMIKIIWFWARISTGAIMWRMTMKTINWAGLNTKSFQIESITRQHWQSSHQWWCLFSQLPHLWFTSHSTGRENRKNMKP